MFDFKALVGDSQRYNFHSHTQYCDGHATMADFARAAAEAGMTHYGFSPHSPVPIASPCNMDRKDVPAYLDEVRRLQELYPRTRFLASMEIDYLGAEWGPATDYFQQLPLDYRIGSVHFLHRRHGDGFVDIDGSSERFNRYMAEFFDDDIRWVAEAYFQAELEMLAAGGFDLLAHPDKIAQNGAVYDPALEEQPWYRDCVHALVDAIARAGVTVEINTKHLASMNRVFPRQDIVTMLRERNVPLIVNSDAHYTHLIEAGRQYGLTLI